MTAPPTSAEIAELRRLHEEAIPAPWRCEEAPEGAFSIDAEDYGVVCGRGIWTHRARESFANGRLIVASRHALPALLLAAERAEGLAEVLDRLEREATEHANTTGCSGALGAALSDARSALTAYRGSAGGKAP